MLPTGVVRVLFLFEMRLSGLFSCFYQSCLALCSLRLGKGELLYILLEHVFVDFASVNFCPLSLLLGVGGRGGGRLRLVILALPGHFY